MALLPGGYPPSSGNKSPTRWLITFLWGGMFVLLGSLALVMQVGPSDSVQLVEGEVSPKDVLAPERITYISQIKTEAARALAVAQVQEVYYPPDTKIAKEQVTRARLIFDYLESVRADPYSTDRQKRSLIAAISGLELSEDTVSLVLNVDEETWLQARGAAIAALGEVMQSEIRQEQVSQAQRRLGTLVGLDVSDEARSIITDVAQDLVLPNTFPNVERTDANRKTAYEGVQPVTVTYEQGEVIIRAGQVVGPEHIEALETLGLRKPLVDWQYIAGTVGFVALLGLLIGLYIRRFRPRVASNRSKLVLLLVLLIAFLFMARLMIFEGSALSYLYPAAALAMLVAALIDAQLSLVVTVFIGLVVGFIADGSISLTAYTVFGSLVGLFAIGRAERVNSLLWAGFYIAFVNISIVLIFNVTGSNYDLNALIVLLAAGVGNGVLASTITLTGFFIIGNFFGITTSLQLQELTRPTQPLLRQLLLRAPGTYHHSLMVGNLAEQAAERIGANALLTRVGAYYHDIGKMSRPYFFVENQAVNINPHEKLDPYTSARVVVSHVLDGIELAKKYHLPPVVRAFIPEHQGAGLVTYFYHKALEQADDPSEVDEADFRYPGPRPQSRETAIVMLADSCEAAVRAAHPTSEQEIDEIVRKVIGGKLSAGELDESDLTMKDIDQIRAAFVEMLQGVFHPRIKYPEAVKKKELQEGEKPSLPAPLPAESEST